MKQKAQRDTKEETVKMNNEKKNQSYFSFLSSSKAERKAKVDRDNCFAAIITAMTNKKLWKEDTLISIQIGARISIALMCFYYRTERERDS